MLRTFVTQWSIALSAAMEYRVGFWTEGVLGILWSLLGVVPLWVALSYREAVAGWTPVELAVLAGVFMAVSGIYGAAIQPGVLTSMSSVRTGQLDYALLRPIPPALSCLGSTYSPWQLVQVIFGLALVVGASSMLDPSPSLSAVAAGVLMAAAGLVVLTSLGIAMLAAGVVALRLENLAFLVESALDFARWPPAVFGTPLRQIFTFVFPLIVMISFPAAALTGHLSWVEAVIALGVATIFLIGSVLLFHAALRRYTSASS